MELCVANLRNGIDGSWNVRLLKQIYKLQMVEAICKVPWPDI